MSTKKIPFEKEKQILKLYLEDKLSTIQVGKTTGVSPTCVSNILKRNGYSIRGISECKKGIKRGTKLPVTKIIQLYNSGLSSIKISNTLDISKRSVLKILKDNNVSIRSSAEISKFYKNPQEDYIKELYLEGNSINEVMNKTGLSYGGINKILKKFKIIRTENKNKGMIGKQHSNSQKEKVRQTKKTRKEEGLYDHIYLNKTGLTYKEFQEQLPEFKKYFQKIRTITKQQPLEQLENFARRGKAGQDDAYNLDHKFSIIEGFKQAISPEIIGHICNLEMIPWKENVTKQGQCSITLKDLKKLIKTYNKGL